MLLIEAQLGQSYTISNHLILFEINHRQPTVPLTT